MKLTFSDRNQDSYYMMHDTTPKRVKLFSYGTLQLESVQLANFGRQLKGDVDALPGFSVTQMKIDDADVVATSGQTHHPVVAYTGVHEDRIEGRVFDISAEELQRADDYEVDSYRRDEVVLASGLRAWVYVDARSAPAPQAVDSAQRLVEPYGTLVDQVESLLSEERDRTANAANFSALVFHGVPDLNWAGFYFFDGTELVVGPFQGKPACVRIALGKGVCGTAAQTLQTQLVADVHAFPGHIACDSASESEVVVPLLDRNGTLVGVWDVDSPVLGRFTASDASGMEALCKAFMTHGWKD